MTRIGVTGHMDLTDVSYRLVDEAIRSALRPYTEAGFTGISNIAPGADTIFAEAVLDLGGDLEVVVPAADYRSRLTGDAVHVFDRLTQAASLVRIMPHARSGRDAYHDANEAVMSSSDLMFAIWDETSANERGGTTDVVEAARSRGLPVHVVWPTGTQRRSKARQADPH